MPAFASWEGRIRSFAADRDTPALRTLRVRIEDKGPIAAFHWRDVPDEDAARTHLEGLAHEAEMAGLFIHWGRKVLEVRPPVAIGKDQAVRALLAQADVRAALFGGDDVTDLDAFEAALAGRIAENSVLSHDLLEGIFARAGLVLSLIHI